ALAPGPGRTPPCCPPWTGWRRSPASAPATAAGLIAEIGLDMSRFPTPHALVSWAGMAPVPDQSGPRKGRGKKGHGSSYARRYAGQAGNGAARTDTVLGQRHRRIRSRPGGGWKKASVAAGRSILIIVWHLLKDPAARFTDLGPDHYAKHTDTNRKARNHKRQLEALATTSSSPPARPPDPVNHP
ncbi:MAG TPA: transposase, partial [Streptosporangiaceae bacterium]|nr:transposase [Streptosporangiaceae bacterium]